MSVATRVLSTLLFVLDVDSDDGCSHATDADVREAIQAFEQDDE